MSSGLQNRGLVVFSIAVLATSTGCGASAVVAEEPTTPPAAAEPVPPPPFTAQCPIDYLMELNAEIERHIEEMKTCYIERMVDGEQTFGGSVDLKVGVSAEGSVTSIDVVESSIEDPPLLECVIEVVRGLQFQPPPCGKLVFMKKLTFKAKVPDKH